jgi:hypothetical protein
VLLPQTSPGLVAHVVVADGGRIRTLEDNSGKTSGKCRRS